MPESIAAVANEAMMCHGLGANRAALMLARSVIEASAKVSGILKGTLEQKIDKMAAQELLSSVVVGAAHAIRDSGNAVAHADFAEYAIDIEADEVIEVLELMSLVLQDVFQSKAKSSRISEAAARRKANRSVPADA